MVGEEEEEEEKRERKKEKERERKRKGERREKRLHLKKAKIKKAIWEKVRILPGLSINLNSITFIIEKRNIGWVGEYIEQIYCSNNISLCPLQLIRYTIYFLK